MKRALLLFSLACGSLAQALIPEPRGVCEGDEGYRLLRDAGQWQVDAATPAGCFYAQQTIRQLERMSQVQDSFTLEDSPRYSWRGLHLDVSRHWFGVAEVKLFIDRMAALKLNRLHLHLTDGSGWRFEVKAYPRLTQEGAWRKDKTSELWDWPSTELGRAHEKVYGGFYTQEELRELQAYAAQRHVMLVPEVDFPGHSYATLFCYPELALPGFELHGNGLHGHDALNVHSPQVIRFVETVLSELMDIFPPETPIHLGGDEVATSLLSAEEQRAFMQHCVDYLRAHGRQAITWDDAAEMGVRGQIIMCWRPCMLHRMLQTGQPLILCPTRPFYFDYPQFPGDTPPVKEKPLNSLADVFSYTPPNGKVLGMQGNLWSEYIQTTEELYHRAYPRAAALAERAWGSPPRPLWAFRADWAAHRWN